MYFYANIFFSLSLMLFVLLSEASDKDNLNPNNPIPFDRGFELNGFAWVTHCWEVSLPIDVAGLTSWLSEIKKHWPDVKFITQGEFGLIWRKHYQSNDFNYRFEEKGSGIGGSDADKKIRWFMNKNFRLALLHNLKLNDSETVIDFTRDDLPAKEPVTMTH